MPPSFVRAMMHASTVSHLTKFWGTSTGNFTDFSAS